MPEKKRDDIRKQIAAEIDPSVSRKAEQAKASGKGSFELVARKRHNKSKRQWSDDHAKTSCPGSNETFSLISVSGR